jgi:hypothetical protein
MLREIVFSQVYQLIYHCFISVIICSQQHFGGTCCLIFHGISDYSETVTTQKTTFSILITVRTSNLSENVLRHPPPQADLSLARKLTRWTSIMYSFRFSYLLSRFYSNYTTCIYEVCFAALVAPIISL